MRKFCSIEWIGICRFLYFFTIERKNVVLRIMECLRIEQGRRTFENFCWNVLLTCNGGFFYSSMTSDSRGAIFRSSEKLMVRPVRMSLPCFASFRISL